MAGIEQGVGFPITAVDQFSGAFDKLKGRVTGMQGEFSRLNGAIAAVTGGLGLGAFAAFTKHIIDAHDEVFKFSQKLGITVGELSALKYAAGLSDVSMEALTKGVKGLSQKMTEAADTTSKAGRLLKLLGVDAAGGTGPAIEMIATAFAKLPDGATKASLAVELFGKAGMEMIPFLNQGGDGIRRLKEEAIRLGIVMDEQTAKAAEQFNDNLKTIKATSERLGITLLNEMAPSLVRISNAMKEAAIDGGVLKAIVIGLGGALAELLGLNADPLIKRIRAINSEILELQAKIAAGPSDLGGGVQDRAFINQYIVRVRVLQGELRAAQALQDAIGGKFDDQASRQGRQGRRLSGVEPGFEGQVRSLLGIKEGAEKAAKAMKDLGLANEHVTTYLKHLAEEEKTVITLFEHRARLLREGQQDEVDTINARDAVLDALKDGNKALQLEIDTLGMSTAERDLYVIALQEERAAKRLLEETDENEIRRLREEIDLLGKRRALLGTAETRRQQLDEWGRFGQTLASGFTNIFQGMLDGTVRKWSDWTRALGDMFKRSVVDFAGSALSALFKNLMSSLSSMASGGSFSGGSLMGGVNPLGLIAAGGGLVGSMLTRGAGPRGQQLGTSLASTFAMIGSAFGPIGTVIGAVIGGLIGRFTDPSGPANRTADFGRTAGAVPFGFNSAFGSFGITNDRWFSDQDMGSTLRQFFAGLRQADNVISGFLSAPERARVTNALGATRNFSFGTEHEDFNVTLGEITVARMTTILDAIDPSLTHLIEGFEGTSAELSNFVVSILQVRQTLTDMNLHGLDVAALEAWQRAGETLIDTFDRVSGQWTWFTQNFYTEAEQLQLATTKVNDTFVALGLAVPSDITAFRHLVEGLDLSTESGRAMWDALMDVAPAFLMVTNAAGNAATAIDDTTAALERQADIQRQIEDQVRSSRESQLAAVTGARGSLGSFINSTLLNPDLSPLDPMQRLAEARRQYEEVQRAASGGDLGAAGRLGGVSETFLRVAREVFASGSGFVDIFNQVMGGVRGVDARLEIDQRMLEATLGIGQSMAEMVEISRETKALIMEIANKTPEPIATKTRQVAR